VYVAFDVLYRMLSQLLRYDVQYVRNFTDVDDKIINRLVIYQSSRLYSHQSSGLYSRLDPMHRGTHAGSTGVSGSGAIRVRGGDPRCCLDAKDAGLVLPVQPGRAAAVGGGGDCGLQPVAGSPAQPTLSPPSGPAVRRHAAYAPTLSYGRVLPPSCDPPPTTTPGLTRRGRTPSPSVRASSTNFTLTCDCWAACRPRWAGQPGVM
jgi:hypothetical protein